MALLRSSARRCGDSPRFLSLAAPSARAGTGEISFCNEFPHKLYIAIAYLETDVNNYLSRGWLEVETGKCYVFDTAIRVESFYFRAESETYRDGKHKVKMEWGSDKKFAVRDANFQSYNAEKAYSGMRLAGSPRAPSSSGGPLTAIVTFTETGGSTITVPAPEKQRLRRTEPKGRRRRPEPLPSMHPRRARAGRKAASRTRDPDPTRAMPL